jgi:hypothetical protein
MLCNTYPDDTPAYHNVAGDAWGFYHEFLGHCVCEFPDEYSNFPITPIDVADNNYELQHDFDKEHVLGNTLVVDYLSPTNQPWYAYDGNSNIRRTQPLWQKLINLHKQNEYMLTENVMGYRTYNSINSHVYVSQDKSFMKTRQNVHFGPQVVWSGWYRFLLWRQLIILSNEYPNYKDYSTDLIANEIPGDRGDPLFLGSSETNWTWPIPPPGVEVDQQYFDTVWGMERLPGHILAQYNYYKLWESQLNKQIDEWLKLDKPFSKLS